MHKGGQILPGLKSFFNCLDQSTAGINSKINISEITTENVKKWGKNTDDAIIAGVMAAISGALNDAVLACKTEDSAPSVILTGGDAIYFKDAFDYSSHYRPNIVLDGLAIISEKN